MNKSATLNSVDLEITIDNLIQQKQATLAHALEHTSDLLIHIQVIWLLYRCHCVIKVSVESLWRIAEQLSEAAGGLVGEN